MTTPITIFLQNHYDEGATKIYSHQSLITPRGTFLIGRDDTEEFWKLYCDTCYNIEADPSKVILGVAEKNHNEMPILVDIDLLIKETDDDVYDDHIYSEQQVVGVIEIYQSILRSILHKCTDDNLICVVLEKPIYIKKCNDGNYLKNGFRLVFPGTFLTVDNQNNHLFPRIKDLLNKSDLFANLGIEDSSTALDNVCEKPPLLYGSRKDERMQPYLFSAVYNSNLEQIDLETAFKYYQIFDHNGSLIQIATKVHYYLPRILSCIPAGRKIQQLRQGLLSPIKELKIKAEQSGHQKVPPKVSVLEQLESAKKYLKCLSPHRADVFDEWMTVGWILYCVGNGCDQAYELWADWSEEGCPDKFDEAVCLAKWENMEKKDYTIGSLKWLAKIDNKELYDKIRHEEGLKHIERAIESTNYDIAKLLHEEYSVDFVCGSIADRTWFRFRDNRWHEIEEATELYNCISSEIVARFEAYGKSLYGKMQNADKNEVKNFESRVKQNLKAIVNLKSTNFKQNVMKECCHLFFRENFVNKLDINPNIIGFKNGVYDLEKNRFRTGRPEDFISKCMPINYIEFHESDDKVTAVKDFLEKIFPDAELREYFLNHTSEVFVGGNNKKLVFFWLGEGDNGKSITQLIFEKMLGPYAVKFGTTLLTGKKTANGAANPELSRAGGGVRWAVLEEPDRSEELNIGYLKSLSGNDSYWCRDLFQKGKTAKEITPLFKLIFICNRLPSVRGSDTAFWNRIRVIPFETTFVRANATIPCPATYEEQLLQKRFPMDTNFIGKIPDLLEPLAWLLLQQRLKMKSGNEPAKVRQATELYKKQNDRYRQFTEISLIDDPTGEINLTELYAMFQYFWKDYGFNGSCPIKNDVCEHFERIWGEPRGALKIWKGHRVKTQEETMGDGTGVVIGGEEALQQYEDEH